VGRRPVLRHRAQSWAKEKEEEGPWLCVPSLPSLVDAAEKEKRKKKERKKGERKVSSHHLFSPVDCGRGAQKEGERRKKKGKKKGGIRPGPARRQPFFLPQRSEKEKREREEGSPSFSCVVGKRGGTRSLPAAGRSGSARGNMRKTAMLAYLLLQKGKGGETGKEKGERREEGRMNHALYPLPSPSPQSERKLQGKVYLLITSRRREERERKGRSPSIYCRAEGGKRGGEEEGHRGADLSAQLERGKEERIMEGGAAVGRGREKGWNI